MTIAITIDALMQCKEQLNISGTFLQQPEHHDQAELENATQQILSLFNHLEQQIYPTLEQHTQENLEPIATLFTSFEEEASTVLPALKTQIETAVIQVADQFNQQVLHNATQNIDQLNTVCEKVEQPVTTLASRIEQAKMAIETWQQQIETSMELATKHITEAITQNTHHFSTEIISLSETSLTTLNENLQQLNHSVEQWGNFIQTTTKQSIQQEMDKHFSVIENELEERIKALLDTLLTYFDEQLEKGKQALLEAVNDGQITRQILEPALDQLEQVKSTIEEVIKEVQELAESVGISL